MRPPPMVLLLLIVAVQPPEHSIGILFLGPHGAVGIVIVVKQAAHIAVGLSVSPVRKFS